MRNSFTFGAILVVLGIVFTVLGFKEKGLAAAASAQPEEISLAKLIARGAEGNPNIILTDYVLCDNYVFQTRNGAWQNAWVPAVPSEGLKNQPGGFPGGIPPGPGRGGRPAVIQALIFTINARNEAGLFQICEQPRLPALVTNRIMSLGGEERRLLEQSYPGTDFSRCLIIQQGRQPAGAGKLIAMIGGGILATLVGLGLLGFGAFQWNRERSSRRNDDEDDDDRPRRRRSRSPDADDDDRPSRRRPERDELDEDDRPSRRRSRSDDRGDDDDRPARRRTRPDDDDDRPRRRRPRDDDDLDEPRPRRRSRADDD